MFSKPLPLLVFITSLFIPWQNLTADSDLDGDDEPVIKKQWVEQKVFVPPYPVDKNLLAIALAERDTLKIYIDQTSLARGKDWVIRYILVIESRTGVRNVFYEGLRCSTYQYKTYAIGVTKKSLMPIRNPAWRQIPYLERNAIRHFLYKYYFCDESERANHPKKIIQSIKYPEDNGD